MKRILLAAVLALLGGCATSTVRQPDGTTVTLYGENAAYAERMKDPLVRAGLDAKGPAPQEWTKALKENCPRNPAVKMYSDRLYWASRGHPALAGYSDKDLAFNYITHSCKQS